MKQRSEILTAVLVVLIIYNGTQGLKWTALSAITLTARQEIDSVDLDEISEEAEREVTKEELRFASAYFTVELIFAAIENLISMALLIWMFFWKRLAVWCYCGIVVLTFLFNLYSGTTLWDVFVELIGPAILIATIHVVEPIAWPQFE